MLSRDPAYSVNSLGTETTMDHDAIYIRDIE